MKGFTLIELLVVVLIIGILASIALPTYMKSVEKSRASEAVTLLRNLINAESVYFMANGEYTGDLDALDITLPNISADEDDNMKSYGSNFIIDVPMVSSANGISIRAARYNVKENGEYYLMLRRDAQGNEALWCSLNSSNYFLPPDVNQPDTPQGALCKTISNGNKKGIFYDNITSM